MSDLADQAEGLRRLFPVRRARILTVLNGKASLNAASKLTQAFVKLSRRTALISCYRQSPTGLNLADLADVDAHFEVRDPVTSIELYVSGDAATFRLANLLPQTRSRIFARLADLQDTTDIMLIEARGNLAGAQSQVRETVLPMRTSVDGILSAYAGIKTLHAMRGRSDYVVYTFDDRRQGGETDGCEVRNLISTAERFLGITVRHVGSVVTGSDTEYLEIASRLDEDKMGGGVAIEACLAHLFVPERDRSVLAGPLLLQ